ncbi:putative NADH:quinone oxidoreductase/Mrp antiporter, membrane subunit [Helianthus annuus]|nr:putative NADH:quinone oxidoreductase/Mrp antiporter, membrane subunit [Helianthus annuus]
MYMHVRTSSNNLCILLSFPIGRSINPTSRGLQMDQFFDFRWKLGTDQLSLGPVLLTGFITTLAAWPVTRDSRLFHFLMLAILSTSIHVGRKETSLLSRKIYFVHGGGFHFTLNGSSGCRFYGSNEPTLNFETSVNQSYLVALEIIFYIGFLIAFAVKLLILPLHTWSPDTHREAHYSTCMLLAGILLKMRAYGLIRINMELLPHAHSIFSPCQRLSVCFDNRYTDTGLNGAILQIISHGFIGAALFFLAGTSYDRIRLVYLDEMGGVAIPMPKIFTMFTSFSIASLELPV